MAGPSKPVDRAAPGGPPDPRPVRPEPTRIRGDVWAACMVLGILLFLFGVYYGVAVQGAVRAGALPTHGAGAYLPFVFTIAGGALAMYSYEEWYQSPEHREKRRGSRPKVADLPSYEHYVPPRERAP